MRKLYLILISFLCLLVKCTKDEVPDTTGTATINNTLEFDNNLQTYIAYGFLFSEGKYVSIIDTPPPDITVDTDGQTLFLQANNLNDSFFKAGEYADEITAKTAFDNLTAPTVLQWEGQATPVIPHQIWIYRSGSEHYAKIRIISIKSEVRDNHDYAECNFEWVYQPDGTLTFPGK